MDTQQHARSDGSATTLTGAVRRPGAVVAELWRRDPILSGLAALHGVLFVAFVAGTVLDPTTVNGEPAWLKPAKFAGSIALVGATLAWIGTHLPVRDRTRRRVSLVVASGMVIEITMIGGQAARGVGSHFNQSTAFDTVVSVMMGVIIVVVMLTIAWFTVRARRGEFDVHPAFARGLLCGLALFVVGAFEGGAMLAVGGRAVGEGSPTVPVLGWHLVGDFRPAHFVGLHSLQVVPLVGYLAARGSDAGMVRRPSLVVALVAAGYGCLLVLAGLLGAAPLLG